MGPSQCPEVVQDHMSSLWHLDQGIWDLQWQQNRQHSPQSQAKRSQGPGPRLIKRGEGSPQRPVGWPGPQALNGSLETLQEQRTGCHSA